MKIKSINENNQINFNGLHIARCEGFQQGKKKNINFYKITKADKNFISKMNTIQADGFSYLYQQSFIHAGYPDFYNVYIAVSDNKPLGILVGDEVLNKKVNLLQFLTWKTPAEKGFSKVKNAGEGLLNMLLHKVANSNSKKIALDSMTPETSNAYDFYLENGFKKMFDKKNLIHMELDDIPKALETKTKKLGTVFFENPKEVNLDNLDLNISV